MTALAQYEPPPLSSMSGAGLVLWKYQQLIIGTQKMGLESVVDDFVIHLLAALDFNEGNLVILSDA
jgi:hypothetical protein